MVTFAVFFVDFILFWYKKSFPEKTKTVEICLSPTERARCFASCLTIIAQTVSIVKFLSIKGKFRSQMSMFLVFDTEISKFRANNYSPPTCAILLL